MDQLRLHHQDYQEQLVIFLELELLLVLLHQLKKKVKLLPKIEKKREAKKQAQEKNNSPAPEATTSASPVPAQAQAPASTPAPAPATAGVIGGVASLEEKKIRSLLKKLRAIEQLKMKQASGETLEDTQVIKISKEDEIRSELQTLGWNE